MGKMYNKAIFLGLIAAGCLTDIQAQVIETYDFNAWAGDIASTTLTSGTDAITSSSGKTVYLIGDNLFNGRSLNGRIAYAGKSVTVDTSRGIQVGKRTMVSVLDLSKDDVVNIRGLNKAANFEPAYANASVLIDGEYVPIETTGSTGNTVRSVSQATIKMTSDGSFDFNIGASGVYIGQITIESKYITIGIGGYATFTNLQTQNISLPDGLQAYAVSSVDGGVATLSEVDVMEPGKGYVLKGSPNTKYELSYTEAQAAYNGDNYMVGVTDTKGLALSADNYILANGEDGIAFYKSSGVGYLSAGKAYLSLPIDAANGATSLSFRLLPGEITGVKVTAHPGNTSDAVQGKVYNMAGQSVSAAYKGLVIAGGKKFIR